MKKDTKNKWIKRGMLILLSAALSVFLPPNGRIVRAEGENGVITETGERLPVGGVDPQESVCIGENVEIIPPKEGRRLLRNSNIWYTEDSVFVKGVSKVGYNALSEKQQEFYNIIDEAAIAFMNGNGDYQAQNYEGSKCFIIDAIDYTELGLSNSEAEATVYSYDYDHPAYYWFKLGFYSSYEYKEEEWHYFYDLLAYDNYASASERTRINTLINDGVKDFVALAETGSDTLDKIAIVHDLIVSGVDYAKDSNGDPVEEKWAHSVQGVFDDAIDGAADGLSHVVCEGYADTFAMIMNYMDIPNYYILGDVGEGWGTDGKGGGHAWNAVSDDGGITYMCMDVTGDDVRGVGFHYKYFGMPKSDFEKDHFISDTKRSHTYWLYDIDTNKFVDSFDKCYYSRAGLYYESGDVEEFLKNAKIKTLRLGERVISLMPKDVTLVYNIVNALKSQNPRGYTITYKGTEYYYRYDDTEDTVDISEADVSIGETYYEYTGEEIKPEPRVTLNGIPLLKGRNYTVSYSDNTAVGNSAKVTITGTGMFSGSVSKTFSIYEPGKKKPEVTQPTPKTGLKYTGEALALILEGSVSGGTMKYAKTEKGGAVPTDSAYSQEIPKETNAGTYTVYYKVDGDPDHFSILPEHFDVTIAPATMSYTAEDYSDQYDGEDHSITIAVTKPESGYTIKYGTSEDNITSDTAPVQKTPGEKTVYFKITADNYEEVTGSKKITVSKRKIRVSGIKAKDKEYDGNTDAELDFSDVALSGKLENDTLSVSAKGEFISKKAAKGKDVVISELTLSGATDLYELDTAGRQEKAKADISPKSVTVTGITAKDKTYDGKNTATLNLATASINGKVSGDDLSITATGTFSTVTAGSGKTVDISDLSLAGSDKDNYVLPDSGKQTSTTATISKASISGAPTAITKKYVNSKGYSEKIELVGIPQDCGNISWDAPTKSGDVKYSIEPAVSDAGILTYSLAAGTDNVNKTGTINVTVEMQNYEETVFTINIEYINQTPAKLKDGTEIKLRSNVLNYGQKLSELFFRSAVFVTDDEQNKEIPGTLTWKNPELRPNIGTISAVWIFYPNSREYASCEGILSITVKKAYIHPKVYLAGWICGKTANIPSVTGNTGNGEVTYEYAVKGSGAYSQAVPVLPGEYTVKAIIAETEYYMSGQATMDFVIEKDPDATPSSTTDPTQDPTTDPTTDPSTETTEDPTPTPTPAKPIAVKKIKFKTSNLTINMAKTNTKQLAMPVFTPGNATDKTLSWSSSNKNVATVSNTGKITGKKNGTVKITAKTSNGKKASVTVKITGFVSVKDVSLKAKASVYVGKTITLKASLSPKKATNKKVTWTSSNPKVASVSANGLSVQVTGKKAGTAYIRVKTVDGKKTKKCKVTVKKKK